MKIVPVENERGYNVKKLVDPEDSESFLDFSGKSEDQDEADACGASQLKQKAIGIVSDSIACD